MAGAAAMAMGPSAPTADMLINSAVRGTIKQNAFNIVELRQKGAERLQAMETVRWSWWVTFRDLARWINPRLGRFLETPNAGDRGRQKNQRIIDSTATTASQRMSAGLMAGVCSPARPWFKLKLATQGLVPEGSGARKWLDEVERRMMVVFAESNFYRSVAMIFEQIAVFGTGVMIIYADYDDIIRCYPVAAGEYYLGNDARLEASTFARKMVKSTAELVGDFGLDACSQSVQENYKAGRLDTEVMVAHLIMPNDQRIWNTPGPIGMPWLEMYWEYADGSNSLLEIKGYEERPFVGARWNVTGNDPYGRSQGMDGLGDTKQLQIMQRRKAQLVDKLVNPPLVADASLENKPTTSVPGMVTFVPMGQANVAFKPLYEVKPEALPAITADIRETQGRIKTIFFEDLFLAISQLDTVRTATEIAERKEEKMLMLGPALERLHDELFHVAIERTYAEMLRKRLLPPAPAEIQGKFIGVEFVSTLAQAQKAVATTAIERLFAFAGNIAAVKPEIMDKLDADEAIDQYADALGAPPTIVVSAKKVAALREQKAKQAQQAQAESGANATLASAQAGKVLSDTDVGGGQNALALMTGRAA